MRRCPTLETPDTTARRGTDKAIPVISNIQPKYDVRDDRILFIDNELTCWKGPPPEGESAEIIEIGVAELDVKTLEVTRSHSFLVRPVFSRVSDYCTELTGISVADLRRHGRPLSEVFAKIAKDFGSRSKQWQAWGADRRAIDRDAERKNLASPFSAAFVDMGLDFKLALGSSQSIGLTDAMAMVGLERSGRIHSGENDAVQTALLWAELARRRRLDLVPHLDAAPCSAF